MIKTITGKIIENKKRLSYNDDLTFLFTDNLDELCLCADKIRRHFMQNKISLCTIINGKSGGCSENCKFCAQSSFNSANSNHHGFLSSEEILNDCKKRDIKEINFYSIVTAGKRLTANELVNAADTYRLLTKNCNINLCASHGLLTYEEFKMLKSSGVKRCHANIETSKNYFPKICTTHSYDDKIKCIKAAQKAGLEVCSGGIIGMGESWNDRIDMALTLSELKVNSIPINILIPIKGTPFEDLKQLTEDEILRTIAIFRFINPETEIRIAAGRGIMSDFGRKAFLSGANAAITGNMLTTTGTTISQDIELKKELEKYKGV